jgi:hypothetical protein
MSNFDPSSFLDASITEPTTKRLALPAGMDFVGTIGEPKARTWQGKTDPSKGGVVVDVPVEIDMSQYPQIAEQIGSNGKITLTDGIMLDMTQAGGIDNSPGKNGKLRRYREALGMNNPGEAFSFRGMQGRMIRVKIKHDTYEGEIYDRIDSVAKA